MPHETARSDGGGLAIRWPASGRADVLLLHGFASDRLSWLANQPALEKAGLAVAGLDLPGHGASPMGVGDGRVETLAGRVADALDALGAGALHIVGHSLGGGLALLLAKTRPDLVRSLTLVAPIGLGAGVDQNFLAAYPELDTPDEATALLKRLVVREGLISKLMVNRALEQLRRPGARDALRTIARSLGSAGPVLEAAAADVSKRKIPRLVVWGGQDRINPCVETKLTAFGGEALVVPDTGHLPHIEAPQAVNPKLLSFLASADVSATPAASASSW